MLASPCGKQAICENAVPGYNCRCPQGYAGQPTPDVACEQVMRGGHFFSTIHKPTPFFSFKKRGKRLFRFIIILRLKHSSVKLSKKILGLFPSKVLPLGRALYIIVNDYYYLDAAGSIAHWGNEVTRCASLMTWHFPFSICV